MVMQNNRQKAWYTKIEKEEKEKDEWKKEWWRKRYPRRGRGRRTVKKKAEGKTDERRLKTFVTVKKKRLFLHVLFSYC